MSKLILSMDSGKYLTKSIGLNTANSIIDAVLEGKRVSLRSKLYNLKDGDTELAGNSYKVEFDGESVIIGEQGTTDGADETNKATLLHKLCIYSAITSFIKAEEKIDVYMVLSCPLNLLKSVEYKEEFKRFIMNDGNDIEIIVNNERFIFTIKDITIKSEASGIIYLNRERFIDCEVGLTDIGGLNMQFCKYVNGVPKPLTRFTEMSGSTKLIHDLREDLEILRKGKPISFEQAELALKNKVLRINNLDMEESREIIKSRIYKYIENDVISPITRRRHSLDLLKTVVVGGTCINIKDELKEKIENIDIPEDPQWASVTGLFKIAYAKYYGK